MSGNKKKQAYSSHTSLETQILKTSATSEAKFWWGGGVKKMIGGKPIKKKLF